MSSQPLTDGLAEQENWEQRLWQSLVGSQSTNQGQRKKKKNMKSTPNPRNSPSKVGRPKVIWAEEKRKEDDPREHAKSALGAIDGISIPVEWTEEHPVFFSSNIAAVLEGTAKTVEEKQEYAKQIKELKAKAERAAKHATVADDEVIDQVPGGAPAHSGGPGRNGGGAPPGPPDGAGRGGRTPSSSKKRKFEELGATHPKELYDAILAEPPKRQKLSTIIQTQAPVDLVRLNPQPIRLNYQPHPLEDQPDEWYMDMFRKLYKQIEQFVVQFYAVHDIDHGAFFEPWACGMTPEFINWAEQVAEPDPAVGGWDNILRNTELRQWFIMGILMRIIQKKIFDEDLFGANEQQRELFHGLDRALFQREGFSRQALRSETVRTIIGRSPVTENFYPSIAQLTARVMLLLHPLTSYLYALPPPPGTTTPSITTLYQSLHNLLSNAAYLSIAIRLSPTIFYFTPLSPGETYIQDDHLNFSMTSYTHSKSTTLSSYSLSKQSHNAMLLPKTKVFKRLQKAGQEHTSLGRAAADAIAEIKALAPPNPTMTYRALVGIACWPVVTRFKAGGEEDDGRFGCESGKHLVDKDGFRIFQISKGGGVFYYGRERRGGLDGSGEERERMRLRYWVRMKERERIREASTSLWGFMRHVIGLAAVAALAGMGWALKERGIDGVVSSVLEDVASVMDKM